MPISLGTWEAESGEAWFEDSPDKEFLKLISKITRAKLPGGVAQEVEPLLCKCKALSSNPVLPKQ
jgi:hypothetical protein